MRGRYQLEAASGKAQDAILVKTDFERSKAVENVRFGNLFVFYQSLMKWIYVDYKDIVWVYRNLEDVQSRLGIGEAGNEIHSLMIVTKDKKRIGMLLADKEQAVEGLELIRRHNPFVDIGFSKEKEKKYLV